VSEDVLLWVQQHDAEMDSWTATEIAEELNKAPEEIRRSLLRLRDANPSYIEANEWSAGTSGSGGIMIVTPYLVERGLRHLGAWPSPADIADRLIEAISELAESAEDPDERSRLEALGGYLVDLSKPALGAAIVTALRVAMGVG